MREAESHEQKGTMKTSKDLFLRELRDMYDSEQRIIAALPKLIKVTARAEVNFSRRTDHDVLAVLMRGTLMDDPRGRPLCPRIAVRMKCQLNLSRGFSHETR